ncbi:MAG: hypothetical protein QXS51_01565 [Thermoproteota archaeon]|nr:hypothetical protein [Candidatus Brockarchaeota archaeon]
MEQEEKIRSKVARAVQLLLFKSHRIPGVKGWELKKNLGPGYLSIIKFLNTRFQELGLTIKIVSDDGNELSMSDDESKLSTARFYVTLKDELSLTAVKTLGWSIDEIAGLAVVISTIISHKGSAPVREVEEILKKKFPEWKVKLNLARYIRRGYIAEDGENLVLGWRTFAELDVEKFIHYILSA